MLHPNEYIAGIHDVMAAELLAASSLTNPGAEELAYQVNDLFGRAFIHRQRARRLRHAARRASMMGAHDLSAVFGRVAAEQDGLAEESEAVGVSCIRGMHAFGYYSPEEQRLLKRKAFESNLTAAQAESAYSQLTNKLYSSATNYGIDPDGNGTEGDEPDEVGLDDIAAFGVAAECLGGDMPGVFGGAVYEQFGRVFQASMERLKRRKARLIQRLEKLTERLEGLEDQDKSGPRVLVLQKRVDQLEGRIEKIDQKIAALKKTGGKVTESKDDADTKRAAEASSLRAATDDDLPDDDDDLLDDFGGERKSRRLERRLARLQRRLARLRERERGPFREQRIAKLEARIAKVKSGLLDDDSDLDLDDDDLEGLDDLLDDADDFGVFAEVEVFGLSEGKIKRIERRIERLMGRRARLAERERGPLRERRIAKIDARIAKLKAALEGGEDIDLDDDLDSDEETYLAPAVSPKAYSSQEEWLSSFAGSLARHPHIANRQPYVQFFRRRAERRRGSLNIHPSVMGEANGQFFEKVKTTVAEKQPARKAAAFVAERAKGLKAKTTQARLDAAFRRTARQMKRDELEVKSKAAAARQERKEARRATATALKTRAQVPIQARRALRSGEPPAAPAAPAKRTYEVKPGDTLYLIALAELGDGWRFKEIAKMNRISNPDVIKPGQVLVLPA